MAAVGSGEQRKLSRAEVELLYPLVRGRYWTARDVPINQDFGHCVFPFIEPELIKGTSDIPIALKSYGVFEGRMINYLSPSLAAYPSNYGFSFDIDPPTSYRIKAQTTYRRPPRIRRYTHRLKQLRRQQRPYFLQDNYIASVIDADFPHMRRYFKIDKINDVDILNRVVTMEYVCHRLGGSISGTKS